MDSDANLKEQRRLAARLYQAFETDAPMCPHDISRLCDLVEALDTWLTNGGGLPQRWSECDRTP